MALQNIGASNSDDAFYRYKMPRMVTKIEGRGNGIKTNIVNMVDIAKALARPASYTTKYFGCELGAQSKFDQKTGTALVNGSHDTAKLAALLEIFIKKYVQCYGCGNPETEIIITKQQMLNLKCAACGFVSVVDMRDKLTSFILKNPPEKKKSSKDKKASLRRAEQERIKEGEAADEELKKLKKAAKKKDVPAATKASSKGVSSKKKNNASDEDHSPAGSQTDENDHAAAVDDDDDDDDGVQWQTDTSAEAARQRIQEQLSAVTADMVILSTEEKSKPAKKSPDCNDKSGIKGQENDAEVTDAKLNSGNKSPEHEEKSNANGHENGVSKIDASITLANRIKKYLNESPSAGQLVSFMGSLSGTPQEIMDALLEAFFDGVEKGFAKLAVKNKRFLAAATKEEGSHMVLLHAVENFCGKTRPEAVKEVALILKALYDADVLEEEFILQWYQQGLRSENKSSAIWKNAKPFIDWLQNAESESE